MKSRFDQTTLWGSGWSNDQNLWMVLGLVT